MTKFERPSELKRAEGNTSRAALKSTTHCRSCRSKALTSVFDLGSQPFANALLKAFDQEEQAYPLNLGYCQTCGLAQLLHTADPAALSSHYVWVTGTSSTARAHAERFCDAALARLSAWDHDHYVLEIASNDGTFLKPFISRGITVLGVDPAENIAGEANANGIRTWCGFFGSAEAEAIIKKHGQPALIIARNVLPHVADPTDFVLGISHLLGPDGLAVIEFHDGSDIQRGLQYDSIYHEHLCYFTVSSMAQLLASVGLQIVGLGASPISGGSVMAYIRRSNSPESAEVSTRLETEQAGNVNSFAAWRDFGARATRHAAELKALIEGQSGKHVVGYGASARSSTLLNFAGIDFRYLSAIADQNPLKQGLYTAGTRIPVRSPAQVFSGDPDTVLLLAWNFRDEIEAFLRQSLNYTGRLIVPLPREPIIAMCG